MGKNYMKDWEGFHLQTSTTGRKKLASSSLGSSVRVEQLPPAALAVHKDLLGAVAGNCHFLAEKH